MADLVAVHVRHHDIKKNGIKVIFLDFLKSRFSVFGFFDFVAVALQ